MKHEEFVAYYEYLQSNCGYGTHPIDLGRAVELHTWLTLQMPPGSSVLDCSCGRGFLLSLLRDSGYVIEGTEASAWEIENVLEPRKIPVRRLFYSQLGTLPEASWDAVVSNDVLEHLFSPEEVRAALRELARITRKWICITVGLNHATRVINNERVDLHHVVQPASWWIAEVAAVSRVRHEYRFHNSHMIFSEVTR
jgi:2-polyprenyl-3-methyl-5-hydroxy-6-metoxy-1,4-benzoquinol methylase